MGKRCIECGKNKRFFAYNYAGFQIGSVSGGHIKKIVLPGNKQEDFLCVDCANKRKLVCKKHGEVRGRIRFGHIPTCKECARLESLRDEATQFPGGIKGRRTFLSAKAAAKVWWESQPVSKSTAQCDRCNTRIPRDGGCLTRSLYSTIEIGTHQEPDMISGLLGSSPDLVCESCFIRAIENGESWAVSWNSEMRG